MFYFRLDRVGFRDNGTVKSGFGIFGHDFAKVKFLSFITPSDQRVPELDEWARTNDTTTKKTMLQALVSDVLSARILTELDRVQDGVPIRMGDTGLVLYEAEHIPESFSWTFVAVGSKRDLREAARDTRDILSDPSFDSFSNNLLSIVQAGATVANPAYAAAVAVAKFVAEASASKLMKKGDRQLGSVTMSLIRSQDYPNGARESHEVQDMTGNMLFDYTIFGYERALPVIREQDDVGSGTPANSGNHP